jgi:hypothetical protein
VVPARGPSGGGLLTGLQTINDNGPCGARVFQGRFDETTATTIDWATTTRKGVRARSRRFGRAASLSVRTRSCKRFEGREF